MHVEVSVGLARSYSNKIQPDLVMWTALQVVCCMKRQPCNVNLLLDPLRLESLNQCQYKPTTTNPAFQHEPFNMEFFHVRLRTKTDSKTQTRVLFNAECLYRRLLKNSEQIITELVCTKKQRAKIRQKRLNAIDPPV